MSSQADQDDRSNGRPFDFAFRFEYRSGSVPPPNYHEYTIEVAPDGSGEIHYRYDYETNHPDEFVAIFTVPEEAFERVFRLMQAVGLLNTTWYPPRSRNHIGGSQAWLEVNCGGCSFEAVSTSNHEDSERMEPIIQAIKDLVPQEIWDKIEKQRPAE